MSSADSLKRLALSHDSLYQVLDNLGSGLIILDLNKVIIGLNKWALKMTGYEEEELLGKLAPETLFALFTTERCTFEYLLQNNWCEFDALMKRKDQSTFYAHLLVTVIDTHDRGKMIVINFFDITEKKALEKELFQASITDYLTGLYNRRFIMETLQKEKELSDRYNLPFSLVLLDLDYFKFINDIYGHDMGDRVLIEVGRILKEKIRASDVSARMGGEEFLILLRNTTLDKATIVAEKIREEITGIKIPPLDWVSASFGVTAYQKNEPINDTLRRADLALLKAKALGKNCVITFEE
ncbi:MAG: sensor domain-containing diguanylate cyclase [Caldimicrobium sp.]|nr:sensor domain-containing diguanylate cyclase [Caldimicrobium sp.]MCX7613180.1 sensor domain-containing diguanylate cyclase [Caldimicrobium sp.]MDW8182518.1 sensor domain-containing diguanylate cyclase [Caldimicrobium sp.]